MHIPIMYFPLNRFRLLPAIIFFLVHAHVTQGQTSIPFDSLHWDIKQATVTEYLGKVAATGRLQLKDSLFGNGILEVDIAVEPGIRAYPGILFRKQGVGSYERIYLRPHRSGFYDDALQYAPAFNGDDSWQLYSGAGNAAKLDIQPGRWNRLKIVISEERADVYWNNASEPILQIGPLEHGHSEGSVELLSTAPGKVFFSSFTMLRCDTLSLQPRISPEPVCGAITAWEISSPYPLSEVDFNVYPSQQFQSERIWKKVTANDKGVVDVSRHHRRNTPVGDCIMARTTIMAEKDTLVRMGFGYSDYITVYLNTQPVFSGNSAYQSRDGSFLGIVGYHDVLFLPLKKGANELTLQVGETMGGWAFCFRKEDQECLNKQITKVFTLKQGISYPEAIVFDEQQGVCYVSNYFQEGGESISLISPDGRVLKDRWVEGLQRPTGMCVKDRTLYAVDRSGLNIIDMTRGVVIEKKALPELLMPNDVTVNRQGTVFISDTRGNSVFRLMEGKSERWLGEELVEAPNALMADGENLLVGQNRKLLMVSFADKKVRTLAEFADGSNIDGIQTDGEGNYLVSDYKGTLYRISPAGQKELLINTTTPGGNIADFVYIRSMKRFLIPTLLGNSVTGYDLQPD